MFLLIFELKTCRRHFFRKGGFHWRWGIVGEPKVFSKVVLRRFKAVFIEGLLSRLIKVLWPQELKRWLK